MKLSKLKPCGFRLNYGELEKLCASIKKHGLLEPLLLTPKGRVICGHRRLKALQLLGIDEIPDSWAKTVEADPLEVFLEENLTKKPLEQEELELLGDLRDSKRIMLFGKTPEEPQKSESPKLPLPPFDYLKRATALLDGVLATALFGDNSDLPEKLEYLLVLAAGALMGVAVLSRRVGGAEKLVQELKKRAEEASPAIIRALWAVVEAAREVTRTRLTVSASRFLAERQRSLRSPEAEYMDARTASENLELLEDELERLATEALRGLRP